MTDVLVATRRISQFTEGIERAAFLADVEKQSAVLHQLMVLGEAVRRLSPETRVRHSTIAWWKIGLDAGCLFPRRRPRRSRHCLVHG